MDVTADCRPNDSPYATAIPPPAQSPSRRSPSDVTTYTETAISTAWATSSVWAAGNTRYAGATNAMIGEKWSPSRLKSGPLIGTIGACRCA